MYMSYVIPWDKKATFGHFKNFTIVAMALDSDFGSGRIGIVRLASVISSSDDVTNSVWCSMT